jgi:FlaG/FlaF family flagellin (archaellin)
MRNDSESATSQTTAHLLLVAITVILAILLLLSFHLPNFEWGHTEPPVIFKIVSISSTAPTFESHIFLKNIVKKDYENKELSAKIYCNDALLPCTILTLNTHDFISTAHYGIKNFKGQGGTGELWNYNQLLRMDLSNGFIHPGDIIRVDIIQTATDTVISRDSMKAP